MTQPLKDATRDQWDWSKLVHLNLLLQGQNLKLNYPHLMGNLEVSLKPQNPSQNIAVATQENLTLSRRKFTKSAGAPIQPGGGVCYVENNSQNK